MATEMFSDEYSTLKAVGRGGSIGARIARAVRDTVSPDGDFKGPLAKEMRSLRRIFGQRGFDTSHEKELNDLRLHLATDEGKKILECVGIDSSKPGVVESGPRDRAAMMKFLRHLYMCNKRGSQAAWVFSCPESFDHYPTLQLKDHSSSAANVLKDLDAGDERFSSRQIKLLGEATITGMAWCQKTNMALARVKSDASSAEMKKFKTWFADGSSTDKDLMEAAAKIAAGFKKVTATLNSNQVIYTDMPSIRRSSNADDKGLRGAYAFVFGGRYEGFPIVYIEEAFFAKNSTPIPDKVLYPLTVVHEVTHLDASTDDHRYDFKGLTRDATFPFSQAIENADSWAYYCADCAGMLSDSARTSALTGW